MQQGTILSTPDGVTTTDPHTLAARPAGAKNPDAAASGFFIVRNQAAVLAPFFWFQMVMTPSMARTTARTISRTPRMT